MPTSAYVNCTKKTEPREKKIQLCCTDRIRGKTMCGSLNIHHQEMAPFEMTFHYVWNGRAVVRIGKSQISYSKWPIHRSGSRTVMRNFPPAE